MQSEQQFEQLMLQYNQLKAGIEEIRKMIISENFEGAISMIKSREEIFLNCKNIRKFLELTPVQQNVLDKVLNEIREGELENMRMLSQSMVEVQDELKKIQQGEKIQNAYDFDVNQKGTIVNYVD